MPGGDLNDLIARPQYPEEYGTVRFVVAGESVDGHFQTARQAEGGKRAWRLNYERQTNAQIDALKAFEADNNGPEYAFSWTHPIEGTTYAVRFDPATPIRYTRTKWNNNRASVILVEDRG